MRKKEINIKLNNIRRKFNIMKVFLKFVRNSIKFSCNYFKIVKLKLKGAKIGYNVIIRKKM